MPRKTTVLLQQMEQKPKTVNLATFAALLHGSRNRFFRVVWESNQNKRLKKTGAGAQYKTRNVTKLYVATVRNDYNFKNSVIAELARRGASSDGEGWEPQERTWGEHIPHTPFVIHQVEGEPVRLHGHFLPAMSKGKKAYHDIPGETGYYVDGVKADDAEMKALEYERKAPETELDKARKAVHPVNARLDDVLYAKIGGKWFRIAKPEPEDITALSAAALAFSMEVEAAANKV